MEIKAEGSSICLLAWVGCIALIIWGGRLINTCR